ncbi:GNAT family N-acetyltransferase [Aeromicrobium sp.]|uniref:GNAT family N-acetyltransferase n=1 Tax=Aeromicrobium sp. TaxID=1871063 RepID=UPI003D6C1150
MLTDLPADLTARPLTPDDIDAVVELMRRNEESLFGESFIDRADVSAEWALPTTDLVTGSCGVAADGVLVACAEISRNRGYVTVDRAHTGRGLGTALTRWTERALATRGNATAQQVVLEPDTAAARLLEERGYALSWTSWVLRMDDGHAIAHRALPDGVQVRTFELADAEAVHAVVEDAFSAWIGRERTTLDEWSIENLDREGGDPSHHRVATNDGEVVGASIVHDSDDTAWVYQLAVRGDHRGMGIGQELMAASFEAARARGVARAALGTDSRTGALGLYERLGMRVQATMHVWERPLSPSEPDATS